MRAKDLFGDPNVRRLFSEIRLKASGISLEEVAKIANINLRTLQYHREHDPEKEDDGDRTDLARTFDLRLSEMLAGVSDVSRLCLSGTLLWVSSEVMAYQLLDRAHRVEIHVLNRALGRGGWSQPLKVRRGQNQIIGPLHRFYRCLEWEHQQSGPFPGAIDIESTGTWPAIKMEQFLSPCTNGSASSMGAAKRYVRDLVRESSTPRNTVHHPEWIPPGWEELEPMKDLLSETVAMSGFLHRTSTLNSAWKSALLNQRVLGLILWSLATQEMPRSPSRISWTKRHAPQWHLSQKKLSKKHWDLAWALHAELMHSDLISQVVPDRLWP